MNELIEFFINHWLLSLLLVASFCVYIFIEFFYDIGESRVSPEQAVELINHKNANIVDIRSKDAFIKGHLLGAVNISKTELDGGDFKKIQKYAQTVVLVTCASGKESAKVVILLKKRGFQTVWPLSGGINAWITSGLPLKKG